MTLDQGDVGQVLGAKQNHERGFLKQRNVVGVGVGYKITADGPTDELAVVVNVQREDYFRGNIMDGVKFQQNIERKAFQAGGGDYKAPAQRLVDFINGKSSRGELKTSYRPGVRNARLDP